MMSIFLVSDGKAEKPTEDDFNFYGIELVMANGVEVLGLG
jgi:hypothetical protein